MERDQIFWGENKFHTIHVLYIYLHLVVFNGKIWSILGKYTIHGCYGNQIPFHPLFIALVFVGASGTSWEATLEHHLKGS